MLSNDVLELAAQLGDALVARNWTVTTAESCTGGGIAYAITSRSGSSRWFKQSFVTYSNEAKQDLLNVEDETLASVGAVSERTVTEMVTGACQAADAEVGISVSGIAGPDGGSPEKPVGTVWFGFRVDDTLSTSMQVFDGDRHQVREQSILFALRQILAQISAQKT